MKKFILILIIGLLSFGGNLLCAAYRGIPVPHVHDEFSYLLAADTFAHGRVTNPTHPMWQHFETFHVLQKPTYMSKYPPGQGFFMSVGQVLFGQPIYGVWLSTALMSMAICWMLYAWVPSHWSFIGGVVSILEFGVFSYWGQSYWGGAVASLGGALIFGALPRIFRYQRFRDVIWLGLGVAILVNSRPLEGIFMGLPVGCLILPWKIKWETIKTSYFVKRIVLPLIMILSVIGIGMGSYNKMVTGKASLFPYLLYQKNMIARPLFIWGRLKPMPVFRNRVMRNFIEDYSNKNFLIKRTWNGFFQDEKSDMWRLFEFYFWYVLAVPVLCFLLWFLRDGQRAIKLFLVILILASACAVTPTFVLAHYFSPITSLVVLLVTLGLRTLAISFKQRNMKLIYVLIVAQLLINVLSDIQPFYFVSFGKPLRGQGLEIREYSRENFKDILMRLGGKHLVLVNDATNRFFHNEWVYNGADIDQQPIVWARPINEEEDAKLLNYFKDRRVWRINVNKEILPSGLFIKR